MIHLSHFSGPAGSNRPGLLIVLGWSRVKTAKSRGNDQAKQPYREHSPALVPTPPQGSPHGHPHRPAHHHPRRPQSHHR
uniref:Uncharacterized protein n=1 Tax=Streptomyces sp. W75 TaxID=1170711 RepID=I0CEC8_9ACTN|nr:hypothetical protein pCQ4.16c [Streptomyces sp. W75]